MQGTRQVLITGAAGNLGRAVAQVFLLQDAALILVDRQHDALVQAFGAANPSQRLIALDLLDRESVVRAVADTLVHVHKIDVLCHLAGGFHMGEAVHETSEAQWSGLLDLNVRTLLNIAAAVVPHMLARGAGRIVNVGAHSARQGLANMGAYTAAKASVIRLTEAMSAELRERGINVNCVLPTVLDTPQNRAAMPDAEPARWVRPEDLAQVIAFLASDAARAVHGVALPVTGLS